jgi:hypothetical protein
VTFVQGPRSFCSDRGASRPWNAAGGMSGTLRVNAVARSCNTSRPAGVSVISSRSFASNMKYVARRSGNSASNPESMESSAQTHNFLDALLLQSQQINMTLSHRNNLVANCVLKVAFCKT